MMAQFGLREQMVVIPEAQTDPWTVPLSQVRHLTGAPDSEKSTFRTCGDVILKCGVGVGADPHSLFPLQQCATLEQQCSVAQICLCFYALTSSATLQHCLMYITWEYRYDICIFIRTPLCSVAQRCTVLQILFMTPIGINRVQFPPLTPDSVNNYSRSDRHQVDDSMSSYGRARPYSSLFLRKTTDRRDV